MRPALIAGLVLVGMWVGAACGENGKGPAVDAPLVTVEQPSPQSQLSPGPADTATPSPAPTNTVTPTPSPVPLSPIPTFTPTRTPISPSPSPTPRPLSPLDVMALTWMALADVQSLGVAMSGEFRQEGLPFPFVLNAQMALPDRAHGTFETEGVAQEFLSLADESYVAERGHAFEADLYDESGGVLLGLLDPLLRPGGNPRLAELSRETDALVEDRSYYRITFLVDVSGVVGRLMGVDSPAHGEEDAMGGLAGRGGASYRPGDHAAGRVPGELPRLPPTTRRGPGHGGRVRL